MARVPSTNSPSPVRVPARAMDRLPPRISGELHRLEGRIRALSILSGLALTIIAMATFALTVFALDYWFDLSTISRSVAFMALLATGVGCCAFAVKRMLTEVPLPELAAAVEEKHPEFGERLLSLVEFSQPGVVEKDKGSAMMRMLLERETLQLVNPANFTAVIDHSRASRRAICACLAMGLLLIPFSFGAESYRLLWARLLTPWNNYERPSNLVFEIPNGDRVVPRNEDAKIVAVAGWRNQQPEPIKEVRLTWAFDGADSESRRMAWDEAANAYSTTLPAVQQGFRYSVSSERAKTREFHIRVEDRPAITSLTIEVQPPAYTGLPNEQYTAAAPEILAFEHSQITIQVGLNKPAQHLDLVWVELESATETAAAKAARIEEDSPEALTLAPAESQLAIPNHLQGKFPGWIIRAIEPVALQADKKSALLSMTAERPGRFILHVVDEHGLDNPKEQIRSLNLRIDQPPTIEFADNNEQGTAQPDEIISVPVYATDDVGLAALELQVKTFPDGKLLKSISVASDKLGTQEIGEAFQLSLAEFGLLPKDIISLRARAADERQIPGPNESWTSERLVRIELDSLPYGFEEIAKEREEWKNQLEQLRNEVIANRTEVQDMQKALDKAIKDNKPFDHDAKAQPLADTQREIADKGEKLAATFANHPLFEKLAPGVERVAREDAIPAAEKMQQVPTTPDLAAKAAILKQSVTELNEAEATLRELQTRYEQQAMLERDLFELQRLANRTEQLAEDAETFEERRDAAQTPETERTPDSPPPLTADEQQQQRDMLLARHQSLSQDLSQLIYKRPELVSAAQEALIGRLQNLFDRAGELANKEDRLSAALTREAQLAAPAQSPANEGEGNPPPATEPAPATPPAEGTATPTPPTEDKPAKTPAETAPAAETPPAAPAEPNPPASSTDEAAQQLTESVAKVIEEQQRVALAAKELALNSEAQSGKESAATKAAVQFAEQAQDALQQLTTGSVDTAAEAGNSAVQNGKQAEELFQKQPKSLGGVNEEMAETSQKLAARQAELAARMSELGKSSASRREVQQQAQQQLQKETQRLTGELGQVAESFGMQPLQQDKKAQEAQDSGTSAQRAQEAMLAAKQNLRDNKPLEAAQSATEAAQALRQAGHLPPASAPADQSTPSTQPNADPSQQPAPADPAQPQAGPPEPGKPGEGQAEPPPPSPGGNSSVPPEGALNVAQAAQQLNKIGKQLSQDNAHGTAGQKPGDGKPTGDPQSTSGEPMPQGDRQPNPNGASSTAAKSGETADGRDDAQQKESQDQNGSPQQGKSGSPQSASNSLKQTAANMRKAMSQFGLPNGEPGKPSSGGKSDSNEESQATNQSDFGNTDEAHIVELENHLRGLTTRNWGELPGSLKTEILQATRKKPDGDYSQLIRRYFDEISRTQTPELPGVKPPATEGAAP